MKTIHQLAKLSRRLPRIARQTMKLLTQGRGRKGIPLKGEEYKFYQNRFAGCMKAHGLLKDEIEARRINAPAFRCALPLKKQRQLLAEQTQSAAAEKLLTGQSLAAA